MIHYRPGFAPVYTPPDAPPQDKRIRRPLGAAAMRAKAQAEQQPVPDPKAPAASPSEPTQITQAERIAVLEAELALAKSTGASAS